MWTPKYCAICSGLIREEFKMVDVTHGTSKETRYAHPECNTPLSAWLSEAAEGLTVEELEAIIGGLNEDQGV